MEINLKIITVLISFFISSLAAASSLKLSGNEINYIHQNNLLKVCVSNNNKPFESTENGKHVGITADFAFLIAQQTGFNIQLATAKEFVQQTSPNSFQQCDLSSIANFDRVLKNNPLATVPYLESPLVFTTTQDKLFINSINELFGKSIAIVNKFDYAQPLILRYPKITWIEVDEIHSGIEKVAQREIYGYIGPLASTGQFLQNNYYHNLKINGEYRDNIALAFKVKNNQPVLKQIINKAINNIDKEQKQAINHAWIKVNYEHHANYELILIIILVGSAFFFGLLYRHITLRRHANELKKISQTDKLTNLFNRVKTDEALIYHLNSFRRYGDIFSIILLDIDDFKIINDQYGHMVGDKALIDVANVLSANCRNTDIIGRWGGEEFLIICPHTSWQKTIQMTEKLRENIEQIKLENPTSKLPDHQITASFGVTEAQIEDTHNSLIVRADQALLEAKRKGKNRYVSVRSGLNSELITD
ncbi:diguanylate cyclase [Aliikangiella maris]|uniref:diguanylate cyclase n=2 Tax=Aliikangiella maris TaxID=3162458 RepID=A0ABV3MK28_9GAMM